MTDGSSELTMAGRAWSDGDYDSLSQLLAANAAARLPEPPVLLPGDLAWRLPGSQPEKYLRLLFSEETLTAFAWFEPNTGFEFDVQVGAANQLSLQKAILDWACEVRLSLPPAYPRFVDITDMDAWRREITAPVRSTRDDDYYLTTVCPESATDRVGWLEAGGFEATRHFAPVYLWDLQKALPDPEPPPGCRLRSVSNQDVQARIDVHRAAWTGSQFDTARYAEIRSRPEYREDLDIVLEDQGIFGSYCICWADQRSGVGHFEPVGTRAEWRGKGAGRSVILEGLRRLKGAGMRWARVSTAGFNSPAQALYESCGFEQAGVERTFMKKLPR